MNNWSQWSTVSTQKDCHPRILHILQEGQGALRISDVVLSSMIKSMQLLNEFRTSTTFFDRN